jgi:hypothetical protein
MGSKITSTNEEEVPTQIFHYTSMQGLLGIIETKKIWATNLAYLNDKTEFVHARDMFVSAISKLKEEIEKSEPKKAQPALSLYDFSDSSEQKTRSPKTSFLEDIVEILKYSKKGYPYYVCSFSQVPDQLSQWRGYCQNTYGFSIGFDYSKLKENADRKKFTFTKCIYDPDEQNNVINEFIEKQIKPEFDNLTNDNLKDVTVKTVMHIWNILPILKNEYFQEEQEWRLICFKEDIPNDLINFRQGKTLLIPYYEFELANESEELPIDSIIIGPTPNNEESRTSLSLLLWKKIKSRKIEIVSSVIPYREM